MSRPCFALSVMLCCLAGPLLMIGKAHAQVAAASPSHDPGECIVCPLAYGSYDACGGYSDYDYNRYWLEEDSLPTAEAVPPTDTELEVAHSSTDAAPDEAWESGYEDYYADYVSGDGSTTTDEEDVDAEDVTLEESPAPAALIDAATDSASTSGVPHVAETAERYDEFGWLTDDSATADDYFDSFDGYEPIAPAPPDTAAVQAATSEEAAIDYEAYEEEWFSYGAETTAEAAEVTDLVADEAYEALSESMDTQSANETWGDEEEWYRDEYGYEGAFDEEIAEPSADLVRAEPLETGYDEAYDEAMVTDWEAAEPVANIVPEVPEAKSTEPDYYESYYDAYDDLYNLESTPAESSPSELNETACQPSVDGRVRQTVNSGPAWLTDLVNRMLAPVWTASDGLASIASDRNHDYRPTFDLGTCDQAWDCESDDWAQPRAKQPSVVLHVADTLDGMASLMQNAAEHLRGAAGGHLAETAQSGKGGAAR